MKRFFILTAICLSIGSSLNAQEVIRQKSCNDPSMLHQADSLKQLYAKDGFQVLREASMTMESEYEMPVIAPLQERTTYQIVFIGDITSRLYELRMYDNDEKMVTYQKKMWGDIDGNVISFQYTPKFSEFHMIKPVQVNKQKKKELCGYVMLFQKTRP